MPAQSLPQFATGAVSLDPPKLSLTDPILSEIHVNNEALRKLIKQLKSFLTRAVGDDRAMIDSDPTAEEAQAEPSGVFSHLKIAVERQHRTIEELSGLCTEIATIA